MGRKILVVDDEQDLLDLMEIILSGDGHTIIKAGNGKEALEKVESEKPELIMLDIMMPIMDGWETLKALKSDEKTRAIPVVLVTAKIGIEDRQRGFEEGAADYICKPFAPREVVNRVKALFK